MRYVLVISLLLSISTTSLSGDYSSARRKPTTLRGYNSLSRGMTHREVMDKIGARKIDSTKIGSRELWNTGSESIPVWVRFREGKVDSFGGANKKPPVVQGTKRTLTETYKRRLYSC